MSTLLVHSLLAEKIGIIFDVFDLNKSGFIEKDEYLQIFKFSLLENDKTSLSQKDFEKFGDNYFSQLDVNSNKQIYFKEFSETIKTNSFILNCMTSQLRIQN
jgi:Ca2+-binding EF-hand superfamily protein